MKITRVTRSAPPPSAPLPSDSPLSEPRPLGNGCLTEPPESEAELDARHTEQDRVVIAAALAGVIGKPVAVRRIRPASGRREGAWVRHGREEARSHRMPAPLGRAPRE